MPIKYENIVPWGRSYEEYVRMFDLNANPSCYLEPVQEFVHTLGWTTEEIKVNYEFQKNGNKMLRMVEKQ